MSLSLLCWASRATRIGAFGLLAGVTQLMGCGHASQPAPLSRLDKNRPYAAEAFSIDIGRARAAIREDTSCHLVHESLQAMVKRGEAAARLPDKAQFDAEMTAIEAWLDSQALGSCPALTGVLASQRVLLQDARGMFSMLHDADSAGKPDTSARVAHYTQMHDQACAEATLQQSLAWDAWREQGYDTPLAKRRQRYFINAGTDAYVVREDGSVGAAQSSPAYVGLVHTPSLPDVAGRYVFLQGQGPLAPPQAATYAQVAMAFAVQQHATNVLFVNTAAGQVPSFAEAVATASRSSVVEANYLEFAGWQDGKLVTPADAARFADEVATTLSRQGTRSLLVVNCNAGLDRSGTTNALTQLILSARQQRAAGQSWEQVALGGHEAVDTIVASLKRAKPHSISSPSRYMFVHQAWQAWVDGHQAAPMQPAAATRPEPSATAP